MVKKEKNPYNNLKIIIKRINSCKVREIIKCNNQTWYILNGYNERIDINNISDFTIRQVEKSIKN